jgi:hypothetical protein
MLIEVTGSARTTGLNAPRNSGFADPLRTPKDNPTLAGGYWARSSEPMLLHQGIDRHDLRCPRITRVMSTAQAAINTLSPTP